MYYCFPSRNIPVNKVEHVFQLPLPEVATFPYKIEENNE
jgi:hypothetical protein